MKSVVNEVPHNPSNVKKRCTGTSVYVLLLCFLCYAALNRQNVQARYHVQVLHYTDVTGFIQVCA